MDQQAFELLMQALEDIKSDIAGVREEVEAIKQWKWKRIGAEGLLVTLISVVVSIVTMWLENKK